MYFLSIAKLEFCPCCCTSPAIAVFELLWNWVSIWFHSQKEIQKSLKLLHSLPTLGAPGSSGNFTAFLKLLQIFVRGDFPKKAVQWAVKLPSSVLSAKWHLQILQRSSTPQAGFLAFAWGRPVGQRVKNRRGCQPRWLVVEFQPNPFWNMMRKSKWEKSSPTRGGNKKDLEPPPRYILFQVFFLSWLNPSENIFGKVWNLRRLSGYIWTLFTSLDLFRADSFFVSAKFPPGQTSCHAVLFADFFTPKLWATRVWSQTGNCPDRLISHHNI